MQRHHRRLSPTSRTYRHTRVPAYKVRRVGRPVEQTDSPPPIDADTEANGHDDAQDIAAAPLIVIGDQQPERPAEGFDAAALAVAAAELASDDTAENELAVAADSSEPDDPEPEAATAPTVADSEGNDLGEATSDDQPVVAAVADGMTTELDYAGYLESIEAAAARSRAELRGRSSPRLRPQAVVTPAAVAVATVPLIAVDDAGQPPPPTRTANGRQERGKDPRSRIRRPKTWFVVAAMLPIVASIALLVYFANLAKTTFDAYNDIHVDPTERPHIQINPQGTPEVVPTEQVAALLPDWDKKDKVNILVLGIDPRPDDEEPPRSDTMIVVHIDPEAETVTMMSIPRDIWVYIPGFEEDKINAAYPLGEANIDIVPGGGPSLVAQTIEANFGIPIHYFATVDFDGFRKIVDTIGGIVVDVPAPVKDDQYPTETYGLTRVYFPTGLQKMDGETALRYARTRHGDNDVARGDRQQQVLQAIRLQAISLGLITRASELITEIGDSVRTDLNFNQMLALANLGRNLDTANIRSINLWEMGLLYEHIPEFEGDGFYFEADWEGVWSVMADKFAVEPPPTPTPEPTETPTAEPTEEPTEEPTAVATGSDPGLNPLATVEEGTATVTATATAEAEATPTGPTTPVPGPGVDYALPVVVQNSSGIDLLATDSVAILTAIGFSEVYPDASDLPLPTTVIYDNVGSPDTALYIAELLGLPPSVIQPAIGGTAILVVLGQDVPLDVLRP